MKKWFLVVPSVGSIFMDVEEIQLWLYATSQLFDSNPIVVVNRGCTYVRFGRVRGVSFRLILIFPMISTIN